MFNQYLSFISSYAELIADWPVVVLGVCTVLIVVCALVGILVPDLPDFSDPLLVSRLSRRKAQHFLHRKSWSLFDQDGQHIVSHTLKSLY